MDIKAQVINKLKTQKPKKEGKINVWNLHDPKILYITEKQTKGYTKLDKLHVYSKGMHDAETDLILQNLNKFIKFMQDDLNIIDLGCGEALKTIEIIKVAKKQGKRIFFYPVDTSKHLLRIAIRNAEKEGIKTIGFQKDFTNLKNIISKVRKNIQNFIYFGANLSNFDRNKILSLLRNNMGKKDVLYVSVQLRKEIRKIIEQYKAEEHGWFLFETLKFVGFRKADLVYTARFNNKTKEIEAVYIIKKVPKELKDLNLRKNDKIIISTSFKPKLNQFKKIIRRHFKAMFLLNKEGTYTGAICRI